MESNQMVDISLNRHEAAKTYVSAGLSVIPIKPNGTKMPCRGLLPVTREDVEGYPYRGWDPFKSRLPTLSELESWFGGWGSTTGIAVVCGHVSGNLEAIDIDSSEHVEPWLDLVRDQAPQLIDQLVLVGTPRPGLHAYYRCDTISSSTKLSYKEAPDANRSAAGCEGAVRSDIDYDLVAESRGEGAYALVPPSLGICHPSGRPYLFRSSRTLSDVQCISADERELLFRLARSLGIPLPRSAPRRVQSTKQYSPRALDRSRPGDDFCARAVWDDLLQHYGWSLWDVGSDGEQFWTRPGKSSGVSASVNHAETDTLYVWTSSIPELEPNTCYSKFSFVAHMEYDGDFKRAAAALRELGYGQGQVGARRVVSYHNVVRRLPPRFR